ncbi:unnamed protein product [Nesidiocoris tenuis]|uniref:Cytochrome P450 n=1 Tax=Nesidiocoris tenuis TaxID=355587 RepID=A0A6H5GP13_9HEMI|nr:unnamed protein product [Nesidiocoris tenuis]
MFVECICIILIVYLLYKVYNPFDFWTKLGVVQVKPMPPIISSIYGMTMSPRDGVLMAYNMFPKERFFGVYNLWRPVLCLRDPELVERVLINDFSHLYNRSIAPDAETTAVGEQLASLTDEKWKALRNKLSPTFTTGKIKGMHEQLKKCSESLVKYLSKREPGESLEFKDLSSRVSMDVIASVAFGLDLDLINNPGSEFYKIGKLAFRPSYVMKVLFLLQPMVPKSMIQYFIDAIEETLKYRKDNDIQRQDFLHLMTELEKKDEEQKRKGTISPGDPGFFSHKTLLSNAFAFFTGGFDTTGSALGYLFYELAINQDEQDRIYEEIKSVVSKHDGVLTTESVGELKLLDYALSETLRIHPPAVGTDRVVTKPYQIPGTDIVLPVGVTISILGYGFNLDPQYFPEPDKFNIDRFNPENITFPKGAFIPFGDGPRRCIAERFVRYAIRVIAADLLMNYKLMVGPKTEIPLKYDPRSFLLIPENGVWLKVAKRGEI